MYEDDIYANVEKATVRHGINYPKAEYSENVYANEDRIHTPGPKKTAHAGVAVFLGLLCLLLTAGLIVLIVLFTNNNSDWEMKMTQMEMNYANLTDERNSLIVLFTNNNSDWEMKMTQMEMNYANLTDERNSLSTRLKDLTEEKKHLQTHYDLISEKEFCRDWVKFDKGFYLVSTEKKTWNESREECRKKGADLVIISGEEKQKFVTSFKKRAWIGLTDEAEEGVWKWVDGKELSTSFWRDKQPDNNQGIIEEDCAEITVPLLQWNDIHCWHNNYYICEKFF